MTTKLVIRLLDAAGSLLGWTEVQAQARGDGCLWSPGAVSLVADIAGVPVSVSTHWCDVNVETRVPWPTSVSVAVGDTVILHERAAPLLRAGNMPGPLPPVTVGRAVTVAVPVGTMAAVGMR